MYHSINFNDGTLTYNTYDTFNLMPDGRPLVKSPEAKTNFVDVPGADGSLDYTEVLNGLKYNNRKGSWEFYVLNTYQDSAIEREKAWSERYSLILKTIHGKYFDKIWLEDDTDTNNSPMWYYKGRIYLNEWKSDPQYSKITIDYDLDPYKYPTSEETVHRDWLWDDLLVGPTAATILYGTFNVNEKKDRIIYGGGWVSADCSTAMRLTFANDYHEPVNLPSGITNNIFNIDDIPGSVTNGVRVTFHGAGNVTLYYGEGKKL